MTSNLTPIILQCIITAYIVITYLTIEKNDSMVDNWSKREVMAIALGHKSLQFVIFIIFGKYLANMNVFLVTMTFLFVIIYGSYLSNIIQIMLTYKLDKISLFEQAILVLLSRLNFIVNAIIIFLGLTIGKSL